MYGYLRWLRNEKAMRLKEDPAYTNSNNHQQYDGRSGDRYGTVLYADSRKSQTHCRPGCSRAYITGVVSSLGYGALMALAIKHNWHQAVLFWISIGILAIVALILWHS